MYREAAAERDPDNVLSCVMDRNERLFHLVWPLCLQVILGH